MLFRIEPRHIETHVNLILSRGLQEIFINRTHHLPTFSSPAIEANLHNIRGLSRCFIYVNDDIIFGKPVEPDDFYTSRGTKVYLTWPVPDCAPGCPPNWISDGFCDKSCNVSSCEWDGGDCTKDKQRPHQLHQQPPPPHLRGGRFGGRFGQQPPWTSHIGPPCALGCSNNWLADQFCDRACNVQDCAFDMGDCGVEQFDKLPQIHITHNETVYYAKTESSAVYMNLSALDELDRMQLEPTGHQRNPHVRAMSLNTKHKVLTVLLFGSNHTNAEITIELKCGRKNETVHRPIVLFIGPHLNATSMIAHHRPRESPTAQVVTQDIWTTSTPIADSSRATFDQQRDMRPRVPDMEAAPVNGSVTRRLREKLSKLGRDGHQAPDGANLSQPRDYRPFSWEKRRVFADIEHQLASSELYQDVRRPRRHLMDVYADSLRHVNRLYNRVFGAQSRKVPAHMAHFVDRSVVDRMQRTFADEFEVTSSHRIRAAVDMQFAFSYFYFLMSESENVTGDRIADEFDSDHNG